MRRPRGRSPCTSSTATRFSAPRSRGVPFETLRYRPRSVPLLRLAYRVAYRLILAWASVARPSVRGVKCVLRAGDGRVLLVRHHYGDRSAWELPGGGAKRGESAADAAAREALEELGVRDLV